jgi:flagellar P-ring protein precursor FlgI
VTVRAQDIKSDNVAAVMVTAELPPFARTGSQIDVLVNSIGNAENLEGGTLLLTPLKAPDGHVYAVAQGPVSTGGFAAGGAAGGGVQKNFPTVGRVPNGALIEKEIAVDFNRKEMLTFMLHQPDFTTASRMAQAINIALQDQLARTQDAGSIAAILLSW